MTAADTDLPIPGKRFRPNEMNDRRRGVLLGLAVARVGAEQVCLHNKVDCRGNLLPHGPQRQFQLA
jgi:hypothetical protein